MIEQEQFKRNIAFKLRIGDLLLGKPIMDGEKFSFLDLGNKKIVRVNVVGNIIEKYESEGEKRYIFLKLDDGSGQISLKVFGDDVPKFNNINQGDTILVIGLLRNWNNETYINPEIIKPQDPKYLLVRKIEFGSVKQLEPIAREQIIAIKDKILELIKNSEDQGGIETEKIIMGFREASPDTIQQEIQKLLEDGIAFEPRPGKVRYLG